MRLKNCVHQFENGVVLLFEEAEWTESFAAAVTLRTAGSIFESDELSGLANLTCDMTDRGVEGYDNREFLEEFQNIGVHSTSAVQKERVTFAAKGLVDNWERALELLALQILKPTFQEDEFEAAKQSQLLELTANEDEPDIKNELAFNSILLQHPYGRPTLGTIETVQNITLKDVISFHNAFYCPNDMIVAISGRIDWERLKGKIADLFGGWSKKQVNFPVAKDSGKSIIQLPSNNAQTRFRLGYEDVPVNSPDYLKSRVGIRVLSGGMSSRLFTEVREKRGLCYSVGAVPLALTNKGYTSFVCSTTTERAQESLDVIISEIDRLSSEPILPKELELVKIRSKSSLVMQRESTVVRVISMLADWIYFGEIQSIEEKLQRVNALTCEDVESYYSKFKQRKFRLATLGGEPLTIPSSRIY